jgi:hypothetical protein
MQRNAQQQRHAVVVHFEAMAMVVTRVVVCVHFDNATEWHSFNEGVNPQRNHDARQETCALVLVCMSMAVFYAVREKVEHYLQQESGYYIPAHIG